MFYEKQEKEKQEAYKYILSIIESLSNLFSESKTVMLYYRAHENSFCRSFDAINLSRHDCSADASKGKIGIGLKTWSGSNMQKVAEFGKLKKELDALSDDELVIMVSKFRNSRIKTTKNMYGLDQMIYHVVIREKDQMNIQECSFDMIDVPNIKRIPKKDGKNTIYFTDGKHTYHFNKAKTTLYMLFDDLELLDEIKIKIINDPFAFLEMIFPKMSDVYNTLEVIEKKNVNRKLALKLFNETKKGYKVEEKSGLNIWNAAGRKRNPDEVYIPFNKKDRERIQNKDFFPPQDVSFDLRLPDGTHIQAKVCQENGKAIMSNPNKALGKWLLRDVLQLKPRTLVTYELLQEKGFDTVLFEKIDDNHYMVDFTDSQVYDDLYNEK
ncbi:MAG: NgoFVII family restriction endonuclease [Erysipelotrichia bacterium]|nr:NgoFVII family restriction endonuclease [Erysipelotrichia bacterium]NCC54176.1 NgoFVII family restriction endonuclease [Erysipelotrichia bacterium]